MGRLTKALTAMRIEIGARAYTLAEVKEVAALGLRWVEINLLKGGSAMGDLSTLVSLSRRLGVRYLVHGPNEGDPWDIEALNRTYLEEILGLIDKVRMIGAQLLTVHLWMDRRFIPQDVVWGKARMLATIAAEGMAKGVKVCVENLSEDWLDLRPALELCPELGITVDVGHGQLMCSENRAIEILRRFPSRVLHIHIHDNLGGDLVQDDLHLPVGRGCIDFEGFFASLRKISYRGTMTLEVPVESLGDSLQRVKELLKRTFTPAAIG